MTGSPPETPPVAEAPIELSVVVPVHDEAGNILPLVTEIADAVAPVARGWEAVYVDDGSRDATPAELREARARVPGLRILRHTRGCGQSAALLTGIRAARGRFIATLDGDGQNDPADIPALLERLRAAPDPDRLMLAGWRTRRQDTAGRRLTSRLGNAIRKAALHDDTPDTGCALKLFSRRAFLEMPAFDHMHRYLPALMIRRGGRVESIPVNHRSRGQGTSKYGFLDRALVGGHDLLGVRWLIRRGSLPEASEEAQGDGA